MKANRTRIKPSMRSSLFLPLLLGLSGHILPATAQSLGTFTATGNMTRPRANHSATLLTNGKVLIAGVVSYVFPPSPQASAELYDPSTGTFTATGNMVIPRRMHTATLLADGRVLIVGGFVGLGELFTASAELYDPSAGTFVPAGEVSRTSRQAWHSATLLRDGKVLIAGIGSNARLYDPVTGTFDNTSPYAEPGPEFVQTATLLQDGRVLITGCTVNCLGGVTQIYDPRTNTFSLTGPMRWWINVNTATLLMNGKVLIAGSNEYAEPANAEVYDPATGTFTGIENAAAPHQFSTAVLLPDGTVFIAGGQLPGGGGDPGTELYTPTIGTFALLGNMIAGRHSHTATLLPGGTVLIAGGYPSPNSSAEIYRPSVMLPAPVLYSLSGDGRGQGAVLHAGTANIVSLDNPAAVGEALEIYLTGLMAGSVIPPQVSIGGRMAEVLYFGNAPGFAGLNQVNVRVPSGVAPGQAVPLRLNYLKRSSNEVTISVR